MAILKKISNQKIKNVKLIINNTDIGQVYEIRFLGMILDYKLYWKDHLEMLKLKCKKHCNII